MLLVILTVLSKLKVTGSHIHCKCGNISETMQVRVVVTTDHLWEVIWLLNSGSSDDLERPSW